MDPRIKLCDIFAYNVSPSRLFKMLSRCSVLVLVATLLATAANAQEDCNQAGGQLVSSWQELQSARSTVSEALTEYSACVQNLGRAYCTTEYAKLQYARHEAKTALSGYKIDRSTAMESGCIEQSAGPFGKVRGFGVWPPE